MERSIADFVRACEVLIADEQDKPLPDNGLIAVLCDAVRLTREMKPTGIEVPSEPLARVEGTVRDMSPTGKYLAVDVIPESPDGVLGGALPAWPGAHVGQRVTIVVLS